MQTKNYMLSFFIFDIIIMLWVRFNIFLTDIWYKFYKFALIFTIGLSVNVIAK